MSALRRDLIERRLWPLVALLLVAVVAVPLLLLKHAPANGARAQVPPIVVLPVQPPSRGAAADAPATLRGRLALNPFASGMPKLTANPGVPLRSAATSSTAGTQATLVTPTPAAVTPSAAASSSQSTVATSTPATGSASSQGTSSVASSTTASSNPPPTTQVISQPSARSWTIYAVDLRVGKYKQAPVRRDLARLTLLPSPNQPELMFMGTMAGGRQAVFALGAGVQHSGAGECRPQRRQCSAILLRAGQTELITVPNAGGGQWQLLLQLVNVRSRVTRSQSEALAAYKRQSAAGRCDLDLAKPMTYSQSEGTVSAGAGTSCRRQPAALPFPSAAQSL
jgi:hypothetical protein